MNAYELADDLENSNGLQYITKVGLVSLSAQTLRQQADHIAELEKQLNECGHYEAMMHDEYMERIAELEKEKIRAYDNGFEDGQKSLTSNPKESEWEEITLSGKNVKKLNQTNKNLPKGKQWNLVTSTRFAV